METITENILNVTLLEPKMKHPTIFQRFDDLPHEESLTILNDHDPKPLYYQLLGERGNIFQWEYLQEGPEWWKVKITKRPAQSVEPMIGEIAASDMAKVEVFKKYGIDYCCGGKKTLSEACLEKGLDTGMIKTELDKATNKLSGKQLPFNEWNLGFLSDFIINTHHTYLRKALPAIRDCAEKVMKAHVNAHPWLKDLFLYVCQLQAELSAHLLKEEMVLFPYIKSVSEVPAREPVYESQFGTVKNPIHMMEMEHDAAGEMLGNIRKVTSDYTLPEDACTSFRMLYRMLIELEEDLHQHIHLENNLLFPKAIELENTMNSL